MTRGPADAGDIGWHHRRQRTELWFLAIAAAVLLGAGLALTATQGGFAGGAHIALPRGPWRNLLLGVLVAVCYHYATQLLHAARARVAGIDTISACIGIGIPLLLLYHVRPSVTDALLAIWLGPLIGTIAIIAALFVAAIALLTRVRGRSFWIYWSLIMVALAFFGLTVCAACCGFALVSLLMPPSRRTGRPNSDWSRQPLA